MINLVARRQNCQAWPTLYEIHGWEWEEPSDEEEDSQRGGDFD
jgi:hypothetical protein